MARHELDIQSLSASSALVGLQDRFVQGEMITAKLVAEAVVDDIDSGAELSEVFLTKFIRQVSLPSGEMHRLVLKIQHRISGLIFTDSALFLNYSKATVVLAKELQRKRSALPIALRL
jgi:hypothetical protein